MLTRNEIVSKWSNACINHRGNSSKIVSYAGLNTHVDGRNRRRYRYKRKSGLPYLWSRGWCGHRPRGEAGSHRRNRTSPAPRVSLINKTKQTKTQQKEQRSWSEKVFVDIYWDCGYVGFVKGRGGGVIKSGILSEAYHIHISCFSLKFHKKAVFSKVWAMFADHNLLYSKDVDDGSRHFWFN